MGTYGQEFIHFDQQGYQRLGQMLAQWQKSRSTTLDNKSLVILKYFGSNPNSSTYRCYKFLNTKEQIKISYKNVHKKVHNLLRIEFIKKIERKVDNNENVNHG